VTNTTYLLLFAREMLTRRSSAVPMHDALDAIPARD